MPPNPPESRITRPLVARLTVSADTGSVVEALDELGLPIGAEVAVHVEPRNGHDGISYGTVTGPRSVAVAHFIGAPGKRCWIRRTSRDGQAVSS